MTAKRAKPRNCPRCKREESLTVRVHWLLPEEGEPLLYMMEVECSVCAYFRRLQTFGLL